MNVLPFFTVQLKSYQPYCALLLTNRFIVAFLLRNKSRALVNIVRQRATMDDQWGTVITKFGLGPPLSIITR